MKPSRALSFGTLEMVAPSVDLAIGKLQTLDSKDTSLSTVSFELDSFIRNYRQNQVAVKPLNLFTIGFY